MKGRGEAKWEGLEGGKERKKCNQVIILKKNKNKRCIRI